jgi:starch phosphorylase
MKAAPRKRMPVSRTLADSPETRKLLDQYGFDPAGLTGTDNAFYERHLLFDHVLDPAAAGTRERFEAFARSVRDILSQ